MRIIVGEGNRTDVFAAEASWRWGKGGFSSDSVEREAQMEGSTRSYRILMVTGIYPEKRRPHSGTFIRTQVEALRQAGHTVDVLCPGSAPAPLRYLWAALLVFLKTWTGRYDL